MMEILSKQIKRLCCIAIIVMSTSDLYAFEDFNYNGMAFQITNSDAREVRAGWETGGSFGQCMYKEVEGEVIIPSSVIYNDVTYKVTGIAKGAFRECVNLTSVVLPETLVSIGVEAFYGCTALSKIKIPNSVTVFGDGVFSGCTSLTSVNIPNSMTTISSSAFSSSGLKEIVIPQNITSIGNNAFWATKLKSVEIPNSVTEIGQSAFEYSSLETVVIGENVATIRYSAFNRCYNLSTVYSKILHPSGNKQVFTNISFNAVLYVPKGTLSVYKELATHNNTPYDYSMWSAFSRIEEREAPVISLLSHGDDCINMECINVSMDSVQIGTGYSPAISMDTKGFLKLTSVVYDKFGNEFCLAIIGDGAFNGCREIESIFIPKSVYKIQAAFEGCEKLKSYIMEHRNPSLIEIGENCFDGMQFDAVLYVPAGTKERYEALEPWNKFSQIIESSPISVGDISASNGSTTKLPILLKNPETIAGLQLKLTLPEGVSIVDDEIVTTDRTTGMTIMSRKDPDAENSYLFVMFSLEGNPIIGNEGSVMDVKLDISSDVLVGQYDVKLDDIYMATSSFETLNPVASVSELSVTDYIIGDVNGDGEVDIADAVCIVNHVVGKSTSSFVDAAADANSDGDVDIADAVRIVNLIVGKINALTRKQNIDDASPEPE